MARALSLTPAECERWAQLVARGVPAAAAVRTVLGPERAGRAGTDAPKSLGYRLRQRMAARIEELRAGSIALAEGGDAERHPLSLGELSEIAQEVTSALAAAIKTGETVCCNPALVLALRREVGAHVARVAKLPPAAEAPPPAQGDDLAAMLARLAPCSCEDRP